MPLRDADGNIGGISVVAEETTERKRAEAEIRALLAETRRLSEHTATVAREMGHRIVNSFQMMESLLTLQTRAAPDEATRAALTVATGRVRAMAMVQRLLFDSSGDEVTRLDLGEYLRRLAPELERAFLPAGRCALRVSAEEGLPVTASDASAAAMFVSECVINASKYAFPGDSRGTIAVTLAREGGRWFLEVADDGQGLPDGFEPAASTGLGMRIVSAMARKLGGEPQVLRQEPGTRFRVSLRGGS